jgi:hypothetical protein
VNGHQVDPIDLQAFESFHQGRTSNDDQFFIVIYLIDTFRYEITASITDENGTTDIDDRMDAYIKKAIFRAYMDLIKDLPDKITIRVNIQIIPFESIINQQVESDSELRLTQLKRLAFNIYGQLKRTVSYTTRAKSLTGFGPAASEEKMPAKIVRMNSIIFLKFLFSIFRSCNFIHQLIFFHQNLIFVLKLLLI